MAAYSIGLGKVQNFGNIGVLQRNAHSADRDRPFRLIMTGRACGRAGGVLFNLPGHDQSSRPCAFALIHRSW